MKRCSKCGNTKPYTDFNKNSTMRDGFAHWCRSCAQIASQESYHKDIERSRARKRDASRQRTKPERTVLQLRSNRASRLRRVFGLDITGYDALLAAQGFGCAICGRSDEPLAVDHRHSDGLIRGLLCMRCNSAIGYFGDDPARLAAAIAYLVRPPAESVLTAGQAYVPTKETS